jgi:molybdate transport system substrate-binding protein
MPEMIEAFRREHGGGEVTVSYGASGKLRQQIEAGAPIDVAVFASAQQVDLLVERGDAVDGTRQVIATNSLVLIGPRGTAPLTFANIDSAAASEMIAIGEPDSVPAGHYARQALRGLGKWEALQGRLVYGGHVAAVLQYARRGEVAAAVVYSTDAQGVEDIVVLDRATGTWAPRVETVAVAVKGGDETRARALLAFLGSEKAREIFASHGFGPPGTELAEAAP